MIRREAFEAVGGVRAFPGSENYDLVLRVLDQFGESSIGHVADVLVHFPDSTARTFNRDVGAAALLQQWRTVY